MKVVPRVSRSGVSGTWSLRRLPPRVQRPDRDTPPPPAFLEKRLQAIENKGTECEKERKERQRGGKLLRTWDLRPRPGRGRQKHRGHEAGGQRTTGNGPGQLTNNPPPPWVWHRWRFLRGLQR